MTTEEVRAEALAEVKECVKADREHQWMTIAKHHEELAALRQQVQSLLEATAQVPTMIDEAMTAFAVDLAAAVGRQSVPQPVAQDLTGGSNG